MNAPQHDAIRTKVSPSCTLKRRAGRIRGPWLRGTCRGGHSAARPFGPQVGPADARHESFGGCSLEVSGGPVLEVLGARPAPEDESPIVAPVTLVLAPGELALVEAPDPGMARALAELCAGLPKLAEGEVRFLGCPWAALARPEAEALRGRIGLAPASGGWLPHLRVSESMLLAARHHGAGEREELRRRADRLARHFGLDGVPELTPHELSRTDLARAGCARAFLQRPALLLLESPFEMEAADALVPPLRDLLKEALAEGAAAVWTTRSRLAWEDPSFPATQRFHLDAEGLVPA